MKNKDIFPGRKVPPGMERHTKAELGTCSRGKSVEFVRGAFHIYKAIPAASPFTLSPDFDRDSRMATDWNTPAHMWGLPYTNWKRRTGCEMRDTLAACIQRWLSLPGYQQRDCTLHIGEPCKGRLLEGAAIGREVEQIGLPPKMVEARGGQPSRDELARIAAIEPTRPLPMRKGPFPSAAHLGSGYRAPPATANTGLDFDADEASN